MEGYDEPIELPPGFRFHPTDEELITHYLCGKVADRAFTSAAVGEVDLTKVEPWDLPSRAKMEGKEWYFFCVKDRKYPTGSRANRATVAGYWKATGKDKEIFQGKKALVGMKKTLVFYKGRAPSGMKTNWVMHEYRLEGNYKSLPKPSTAEWVICRVFNKSAEGRKVGDDADLPSLMEISCDDQNLGISRGGVSRALEDRPGEKWIDEFTSKDSVLMPDQSSVLHHLLEMEDVKPNGRPEFIQDPYNELKNFENLEFPMVAATAPAIDLDCLWYY